MAELMELLKQEAEHCMAENNTYKEQRDEFELKLDSQLGELKIIMNALVELETRHVKAVQQYQDEVRLLKAELEKRGGVPKALAGAGTPEGIAGSEDRDEPVAKKPRLDSSIHEFPALLGLKGVQCFESKQGGEQWRPEGFNKPGKLLKAPAGGSNSTEAPATSSWTLTKKTGKPEVTVDLKHQLSHDSAVCAVRFSNSGQSLATGCKMAAHMYDVNTGEKTGVFVIDSECYIRSVCFSPDDKQLATGAEDKLVRVYDVATQAILRSLSGHTMEIFSVDWTSNGQYILSGSGDKSIRVWEADEGTCVYTMVRPSKTEGPTGITCVAVSPDNQIAAAGSLDKSIRFWGIQKGNFLGQFAGTSGHQDSVYAVSFSPDGQFLASGSLDETLRLWDLSSLTDAKCQAIYTGHKGWVLSIAFTPEGKWLISGSKDLTIRFWDYRTPGATEPVAILNRPKEWNSVIGITVSSKGALFATGSGDYKGRIWEYKDVKELLEGNAQSKEKKALTASS